MIEKATGRKTGGWLSLIALALVILSGCAGGCGKINPKGPDRLPPPARERAPILSTLAAPIEVPSDEITALVDRAVPQQLYSVREKKVRKGLLSARLDLDVLRNGSVRTRTRSGRIITYLPLRAEGQVWVPPGISRPFSTTFTVYAVSDLRLEEDWTTHARTWGNFTWETTPFVKVLGIKIGLKNTAEKALTQQLEKLAPQIDRIIEERVNLRKKAEDIWERLRVPIALRQKPPVWLTVEPVAAFFSPGISRDDTLVFGLTVQAFMETVVGKIPEAPALGALPPLLTLPDSLTADSTFQINLPVSLSYADAKALLSRSVVAKDYNVQDHVALEVNDIDLYGHRAQLVARVDFKADVSDGLLGTHGRVFLTGRPIYDVDTQTVRVDSFDYDVHSANALAEVADLVLRDDLLAQTRARLVFPLADNIAAAKDLLEDALHHRAIGKHIVLDATVTDLVPGELYLSPDGIHVDVVARGRLIARVRGLDQIKQRRPE